MKRAIQPSLCLHNQAGQRCETCERTICEQGALKIRRPRKKKTIIHKPDLMAVLEADGWAEAYLKARSILERADRRVA